MQTLKASQPTGRKNASTIYGLIYGAIYAQLGGGDGFPLVEKVQCVAAAAPLQPARSLR